MTATGSLVIKPGQGMGDTLFSQMVLRTLPFWGTGISPNLLTMLGMVFSGLCVRALYRKEAIFVLFFAIRTYFDFADGQFARKHDKETDTGDLLDHIGDTVFIMCVSHFIFLNCTLPVKIVFGAFSVVSLLYIGQLENNCVDLKGCSHGNSLVFAKWLSRRLPESLRTGVRLTGDTVTVSLITCLILLNTI